MLNGLNASENKIQLMKMPQAVSLMVEELHRLDPWNLRGYMEFLGYSPREKRSIAKLLYYGNCNSIRYATKLLHPLFRYHMHVEKEIAADREELKTPLDVAIELTAKREEELCECARIDEALHRTQTEIMDRDIQRESYAQMAMAHGMEILEYVRIFEDVKVSRWDPDTKFRRD